MPTDTPRKPHPPLASETLQEVYERINAARLSTKSPQLKRALVDFLTADAVCAAYDAQRLADLMRDRSAAMQREAGE